jgi:hypothetical protein
MNKYYLESNRILHLDFYIKIQIQIQIHKSIEMSIKIN